MKISVVANNFNHFKLLHALEIDEIILSSKYSSYRKSFTIEEIIECFKIDKNITVSFYDLINETIFDEVAEYIDNLLDIGVRNFIVNDSGLVYYLNKREVNVTLDNITLNTNYHSINIWSEYNVSKVVLGRELTLEEINEISKHSEIETVVHIQGMFPMFSSIRKLVENYQKAKSVEDELNDVMLVNKERQAKYPIIQNDFGVVMFSAYEQCGILDIENIVTKSYLIDQPFVDNETNIEIVKMYLDYKQFTINDIQRISKFKQSRGFFYKKTLYKLW